MKAPGIVVSVVCFVVSGLAFSLLLLPLAAIAKSTFCIDIADESLSLQDRFNFGIRGCGSDDEFKLLAPNQDMTRPSFGWWFTVLHAEFLGVSEGALHYFQRLASDAGKDGEGLLHIKLCAVYLGRIWFSGWLAVLLLVFLPKQAETQKGTKEGMRTLTALCASIALLVIVGLALSILILPLVFGAQKVYCIDIADESRSTEDRIRFASYGCGSEDESNALGLDQSKRLGFGYWFCLLHAAFLGVSEGGFGTLQWNANFVGQSGEALFHLKMVAAYLGQIWFATWVAVVIFAILPRTSAWKAMIATISTGTQNQATDGTQAGMKECEI